MIRIALKALIRHKLRFIMTLGTGLLLTFLYVLASPKKYLSGMSFIVENARKPEVISAEAMSAGQAVDPVTEEDIFSQVELLGSADILDEVVDPGWSNTPFTTRSKADLVAHEKKLARLRAHLSISPVRKSHVIDVNYVAGSPREATETMQKLLDALLIREKTMSQPAGTSHFFSVEADRYYAGWASAQQELADFQRKHDLVSVNGAENELSTALAEAQTLQRGTSTEIGETARRISIELSQRSSTPERQQTLERLLPASGSIDQINTLLSQLLLKRAQLLTEYLPTDRLVQQIESQITEARADLARSQMMNSREVSSGVNPTWQAQDEAVEQDVARLGGLIARRTVVESQIGNLGAHLRSIEGESLDYAKLQNRVAELEANRRLYTQKRDAAQISEAMDQQGLINVAVLQSPSFSLTPIKPRPVTDTALGVFTSLLMACFFVYLSESALQKVNVTDELQSDTPGSFIFASDGPTMEPTRM